MLAAQAQAAVPNPAVQGPIEGGIRGHPWNHTLFPLSGNGYSYTENEYFFIGLVILGGATALIYFGARQARAPAPPAA